MWLVGLESFQGETGVAVRRTVWIMAVASLVGVGLAAPARADTYRLKKGDTLSGVAARFGTTVDQLAAANGITNRHRVVAGRVVQLPSKGRRFKLAAAASEPLPPSPPDGVARGYDVSYPQCNEPLPGAVAFGIVGVNRGRPFTVNPCLRSQMAWASTATDPVRRLYVNTSNPGPLATTQWPSGHAAPKKCAARYPADDSPNCAYDFGYEGARFAAVQVPGGSQAGRWWLDVETTNTWSANQLANLSAIKGTIDYFRERGAQVGIYSNAHQWGVITGGAAIPSVPEWIAGVGDFAGAVAACSPAAAFAGGRVTFTQYGAGGYDANHRC